MERLASTAVYTPKEIAGVLLRAGQFAHLRVQDINAALRQLYDLDWRHHCQGTDIGAFAEDAVPLFYVQAVARTAAQPVYGAKTLLFVACRWSRLCGLCGVHGSYGGQCHYDDEIAAVEFFAPASIYCWDDDEGGIGPSAICGECWNGLRQARANLGMGGRWEPLTGTEQEFVLYLSGLLDGRFKYARDFRARLSEAADRWSWLRFDPRRAETRIAA